VKKPNFFIIGAPKCGTTALSEYLREHPQVFFSDPKELHFFNEDFTNRHTTHLEDYLRRFAEAGGSHKAVGEGSVFYLSSSVAVRKILAFQPEARLIVMLRNPVDMAYSYHSQAVYSFGETERDFEKAWRLQDERERGHNLPRFCKEPKTLMYRDLCKLGEQVERLYQAIPAERVKVVFFEDFTSDTRKTYAEALDFLRLDPDGRVSFRQVNANKALKALWLERLTHYGSALWRPVKRTLGVRARLGVAPRLKRANTVAKKRKPLSPQFAAELKSFFRADVHKLSALTGRDLSHWLE
jgi:hypothetical protein